MADRAGLRERKRQRTHDAVSSAAISLFLEHGFDRVSVADIAAAAEISKPTLFRYFPTKEDLVLHRIADHEGEAARVVRQRPTHRAPLTALRDHFLDGLARRDPVTGLNDHPQVLAFHNLVFSTASLSARMNAYIARDEEALAAALTETALTKSGHAETGHAPDGLTARLAAAQIIAVQRVLARENWRRLSAGETADALYESAKTSAGNAFRLLASGLG
ncbi:TetR/AcrR family transcriptional regulator [Rugosimonospora africana]|uniref:TetR family transcriptional regulator n=1 Tax=Rugosimonospora africana TaxID=556532 RepID=A0A8J3QZH1_9ACTN|nr:TetR/AcrR family transcriptional regulator [Rugosimonospora africana]GIH17466.1 TetR family transcriptional regulator [Rugosimonospora africana]